MNRWPLSLLILGIILLTTTIGFWIHFPNLINSKIEEQLQLRNGSDTFENWRNITIPIFIKFYFFNVINPKEIQRGAIPILSEIGPFVYQETRLKTIDAIDLEKDTVTYRQAVTYYFRPELSVGSEDTQLTVLNIPLVSVAKQINQGGPESGFIATTVDDFIKEHPEAGFLFLQRTVGQMLFKGYQVPLFKNLAEFKGQEILPNHTFGLYYEKNATFGTQFTVLSGTRSSKEFGKVISWNNQTELNWWNNDKYCNQINGTDGSVFAPFFTRDRIVRIFSEDFCRSSYMTYQKDIEYMGIPGYRFTMPPSIWESGDENTENTCFCKVDPTKSTRECSKTGTFSLSACKKGAPVVASSPYFFLGLENEQNMYNMKPNPDDHETFIDIEPKTGMVLQGRKMFQVNVEISRNKRVQGFKKLPDLLVPIVWGEEYATTTLERAADLQSKLYGSVKIANIIIWSLLIASVALIMYGLIMLIKNRSNKSKF